MNRKIWVCTGAVALTCALAATTAYAGDGLESWRASTKRSFNECSFSASSAQMFGDERHYSDTKACVEEKLPKGRAEMRTALPGASQAVAALVKDYFVTWSAAMSATTSLQYGSKAEADRAYQDATTKLSEIWTRIELELGG